MLRLAAKNWSSQNPCRRRNVPDAVAARQTPTTARAGTHTEATRPHHSASFISENSAITGLPPVARRAEAEGAANSRASRKTMASPTKSRAPHKAVYAYTAQEPDELTLSVGDEVHVQQRQEDGWWFGVIVTDGAPRCGLFPGLYVEKVVDQAAAALGFCSGLRTAPGTESSLNSLQDKRRETSSWFSWLARTS